MAASGATGTSYVTADHLGSTRVVSDTGGAAKKCYDYLPFGEQIPSSIGGRSSLPCYAAADTLRQKFTGKERDAESGLDYFKARYFGSSMGRFSSPDPLIILKQKLTDPQQWNMYTYVRNNPLRYVDPTGMYLCTGTKQERKNFEKARQGALKSEDEDAVRAAKAYGDPAKDNGVHVGFAKELKGDRAGIVTRRDGGLEYDPSSPNLVRATVNVTIQSDQASNQETLVHEGSHVADRQDFVSSLLPNGTSSDPSLNLTLRQSEIRAYLLSIGYAQRGNKTLNFGPCGVMDECKFPPVMMPALRDQRINQLLDDPRNHYDNLDHLLFPEFKKP